VTARPSAAVLVTGSEILLGLVEDRNSGFLARELDVLGVDLRRVLSVGDGLDEIGEGLAELAGHDLLLTSGGLGPTHDDLTVAAVARAAGLPLELDERVLAQIEERTRPFARQRGIDPATFADGNRKQALVPRGAAVLDPIGTAPGLVLGLDGATCVVLPGPPRELQEMWRALLERDLLARVLSHARRLARRVLRVYGTSESAVADAFAAAGGDREGTRTTICARRLEVEVLIRAQPGSESELDALAAGLRERLGDAVYAEDERTVEEHVLDGLRVRGATLAVAESCTAGLVAARLAGVAGASDVLLGGVVAYANEVKRDVLGVPAAILAEHGAVSAECAGAMALGARRLTGATVGVAVTGIAGPEGGTPEKPVGLVYLHVSSPAGEQGRRLVFPGGRDQVREWAATTALHLVRRQTARLSPEP
jgi:nicotinamide-nucleotide amidase